MIKDARLLLVFLILFLSACDPFQQPDSMAETYISRLAYQLGETIPELYSSNLLALPRVRERRFDIPELSVSLLDFLSLYGCDLQVLVAEKNSILGRYASPTQILNYDLKFIAEANNCITSLDAKDKKVIDKLTEAIAFKKAQLPKVMWNALWADQEFPNWLSYASGLYPLEVQSAVSQQQLETLNQEIQQALDYELTEMSQLKALLPVWLTNQQAGQLISSLHVMTEQLNLGTTLIQQRLDRKPLCYKQTPTPKAKQIEQLFFNIYIGHMQPYVAQLHQQANAILPSLFSLSMITELPSEAFSTYRETVLNTDSEQGLWQRYQQAVSAHTKAWQTLLGQCGLRPGK